MKNHTRISYSRIALAAGALVLIASGLFIYDVSSTPPRVPLAEAAKKTPANELTVRLIALTPGPGAQAVIAEADAKQQAWAKRLVTQVELEALIVSLSEIYAFDYQPGDTLTIPDECFVFERQQYDADKVQFWLLSQRNKADYLTLGMLPAYMYADNGDWVSGRARLGNPVAIMSSWRMGLRIDDGDPRLLSRWHKLVRHELGHTLGLHHNESRKSLMFAGKSLEDLDALSTQLLEEDWQRLDEVCPVEWE